MVKVDYIGHSCFLLDNGSQKLLIDPFITGNPVARADDNQKKADFILVSHGHGDHLGDWPSQMTPCLYQITKSALMPRVWE
jgi:L-ascorbate metabolism protein UlaG (beta-lactamase superfamily)